MAAHHLGNNYSAAAKTWEPKTGGADKAQALGESVSGLGCCVLLSPERDRGSGDGQTSEEPASGLDFNLVRVSSSPFDLSLLDKRD